MIFGFLISEMNFLAIFLRVFSPLSGANKTPKTAPAANPPKTPNNTFDSFIICVFNV